jgi:hypothetical protein
MVETMTDYSDMLSHALGKMKTIFGTSSYPIVDVQSTIDGKVYKVRDMPDKQRAANMLAEAFVFA